MKTDPIDPIFSGLAVIFDEYRNVLDELIFEWGIPLEAEASGMFEIRLKYEVYEIVHTVSLTAGQLAMLSYLRFQSAETQVIRRKFGFLGNRDSEP